MQPTLMLTLRRLAETLAIAVSGGALLGLNNIPAGWLSGSMLFVAIAALLGRPVGVPARLASIIFVAIGISLGGAVSPQTLKGLSAWPVSIAVLAAAIAFSTFAVTLYLQRVHGWDQMSAFLGAVPGLLSQVIIMATQNGADLRGIAIVQSMRVVILAVGVPTSLALLGLSGPAPPMVDVDVGNSLGEFAILIGPSVIAALILQKVRFPGGLMFGPMIVSGVLHGTGIVHVFFPWWFYAGAVCCLGAVTGSRFANTSLHMLLSYIGAALGSFAVGIASAGIFVLMLVFGLSFHPADVVVSFAPGALDVMMILALTMHLDPIYVGAHHLARFLLISVSLPVMVRALAGRRRKRKSAPKRAGATPPPTPD